MQSIDRMRLGIVNLTNYGYENEDLADVIDHINDILGEIYFDRHGFPTQQEKEPGDNEAQEAMELLIGEITAFRSNPTYTDAVDAYQKSDQARVATLIPRIFPRLEECDYVKSNTLYHGVSVPDDLSPSEYVDLAMKIFQNGLSASPYGEHHSMDENIRPVFHTMDTGDTHGLLFFRLNPKSSGYTVFNPLFMAERLVFTPTLETPMELLLKSDNYYEANIRIEYGPQGNGKKFRADVEQTLKQRGIDFQIHQPDELQQNPYW